MQIHLDAEFTAQTRGREEAYALFARLLRQEVSPELLRGLRKLRDGQHDREAGGEGYLLLERYLAATELREMDRAIAELASDYAGLFLNASDRPVHPYESVYSSPDRLLMQEARDKVRKIYAASGLALSGRLREPEDHIALEMEFMSCLCARAAKACETGDVEALRAHLDCQRQFLSDHLLRWAPLFCEDLARNASTGFYRALAILIHDFLELERMLIGLWM